MVNNINTFEEAASIQIEMLNKLVDKLSSASSENEAMQVMNEALNEDYVIYFCQLFLESPLIRCNKIKPEKKEIGSITNINRFSYPPKDKVVHPQRMNIVNDSIFYPKIPKYNHK